MNPLYVAGVITAVGTAVLTVGSVWKLLLTPLMDAVHAVQASVTRLESKVDTMDSRHQSDIKEVWRHLADRRSQD